MLKRLRGFRKAKCPNCLQGDIFDGFFNMHERCTNCGILFEREHGYFLMSMFIGYVFNALLVIPVALIVWQFQLPSIWFVYASIIVIVVGAPFVFRFSRLFWLYLDEILDPHKG